MVRYMPRIKVTNIKVIIARGIAISYATSLARHSLAAVRASNGKGAGDQARDEKKSMDRSG